MLSTWEHFLIRFIQLYHIIHYIKHFSNLIFGTSVLGMHFELATLFSNQIRVFLGYVFSQFIFRNLMHSTFFFIWQLQDPLSFFVLWIFNISRWQWLLQNLRIFSELSYRFLHFIYVLFSWNMFRQNDYIYA